MISIERRCKIDNFRRCFFRSSRFVFMMIVDILDFLLKDIIKEMISLLRGIDDYFIYFLKTLINIHYLEMNINIPDINIISKDTIFIKEIKILIILVFFLAINSLYSEFF